MLRFSRKKVNGYWINRWAMIFLAILKMDVAIYMEDSNIVLLTQMTDTFYMILLFVVFALII